MAQLTTSTWPTPVYQQDSFLTRRPFLFQVLMTPVTSWPGDLMAQLKGEKLMVVPSTADEFRAAVNALRYLNEKECVSFQAFNFLEDRCERFLVKNQGMGHA